MKNLFMITFCKSKRKTSNFNIKVRCISPFVKLLITKITFACSVFIRHAEVKHYKIYNLMNWRSLDGLTETCDEASQSDIYIDWNTRSYKVGKDKEQMALANDERPMELARSKGFNWPWCQPWIKAVGLAVARKSGRGASGGWATPTIWLGELVM